MFCLVYYIPGQLPSFNQVMLVCPPNSHVHCMPYPSVSHQRNRYSVVVQGGVKYIQQHNMSQQDFDKAPLAERL